MNTRLFISPDGGTGGIFRYTFAAGVANQAILQARVLVLLSPCLADPTSDPTKVG